MTHDRNSRTGLTLVELLTAMTLAAVLLVSVIGVISRLTLTRQYLLTHAPPASWKALAAERIRSDFLHARYVDVSGRKLRLTGFGGQRFGSGDIVHDRSIVTYSLLELDGRSWLARSMQRLDARLGHDVSVDLVCPSVVRLDVLVFDAQRRRWDSVIWNAERTKRLRVPTVCRVVVMEETTKGDASKAAPLLDVVVVNSAERPQL